MLADDIKTQPLMRPTQPGRSEPMGKWIGERSGLRVAAQSFLNFAVPLYAYKNLLYLLGGLTAISIMLQFATGLLLLFYYVPSPQIAYDSVDYVTYQLPLGWLIRGWHYYNASALVILMVCHLLHSFFTSAYKKPREITWLSGVVLLFITLGIAFTGALLRWDQAGYWATRVGTGIASSVPLIGPVLGQMIRGGAEVGQVTLTRFFVLHTALLPLTIAMVIVFHIYQVRHHGIAPAVTKRERDMSHKFVPFFPHWVTKTALLGLGLLALLTVLAYAQRASLEFPADPTSTDYVPRPVWYFLSLYQLLKYLPGPLEPMVTVLLSVILVGSLVFLPFLDRGEERRPWRKPVTSGIAIFYLVVIVTLTVLAL